MFAEALAALSLAQGAALRDLTRLVPIYAPPAKFAPVRGERIRLGSFMPPAEALTGLVEAGISLFVSETDRLGPPDSSPGAYDWSNFLGQRAAAKAAGALWGLSVFTTFPGFEQAAAAGDGTVNLATGERVAAWSPWSMERVRWSAGKYGSINRKFPKLDVVSLGVFGEYGDAGFFTGAAKLDAAPWTAKLRFEPPALGLWSGDVLALDSWQKRLTAQYETAEGAYKAWGMEPPAGIGKLPSPVDASFPYVARLTYQDWYRAAIPSLAGSLTDIAKNIFTESPSLVPLGPPSDSPCLGLDAFRLCRSVKDKAGDGVKVTNVGLYDFASDWAMSLARIRGAARAAELPLFTEAASSGPERLGQRLFEALSLGAGGHTDWPAALSASTLLERALPELLWDEPVCDVAILHPTSSHVLNLSQPAPPLTYRGAAELRDYADFDELEESAVMAGALSRYRVAAVFEGAVWDGRTLDVLRNWVESGGTLVAYDFGKMADAAGNTGVHQELFGFASQLAPAKTTDKWVGEVPPSYRASLGMAGDAEFLLGSWGAAAGGARTALNGATLRLPARDTGAVVTVLFGTPASPVKQVEFSCGGRLLAGVSLEGGLRQVRFAIDKSQLVDGNLSLSVSGLEGKSGVPISTVIVSAPDAEGEPVPLTGRFESPVDLEQVKSWSKAFGKGRVIFFPGRRDQWKAFVGVVRDAIYRLSKIDATKTDARLVDDERDGVFTVDLGGRAALFNAGAVPATHGALTLAPGEFGFVSSDPAPFSSVAQFETAIPDGFVGAEAAEASPGTGVSAVRVSPGQSLSASLRVPKAGRYRIYARTLRNGVLATVKFDVAGVTSAPVSAGMGDVYFVGEFELAEGDNKVELTSDAPFLADLLVVTDASGVSGFRFPRKR